MSTLLTKIATIALSAAVSLAGTIPASAVDILKMRTAPGGDVTTLMRGGGGHSGIGGSIFRPHGGGVMGGMGGMMRGGSPGHVFVGPSHAFVAPGGGTRVFGSPGVSVSRFEPGFRRFDRGVRFDGFRGHHRFRFHHGFGFPLAAFATGALLGSGLYGQYDYYYPDQYYDQYYYYPEVVYGGNYSSSHVEWCLHRYRSYRVYDNTFKPYYGPRQQCISPYG